MTPVKIGTRIQLDSNVSVVRVEEFQLNNLTDEFYSGGLTMSSGILNRTECCYWRKGPVTDVCSFLI